jgi:predicted nucleic-acid-binding protein
VSHLVLAEAVWVLDAVYERTPKQLIAALDLLLAHEHLVLQDADVVTAALAHFRAKPALGFSDCLVLEIARKAGHLPLATFDKTLGRLPGAHRL